MKVIITVTACCYSPDGKESLWPCFLSGSGSFLFYLVIIELTWIRLWYYWLCDNLCVAVTYQFTDDRGSFVSLILTQNAEVELLCPSNMKMPNITFLKDGQPFVSRPVGKVGTLDFIKFW